MQTYLGHSPETGLCWIVHSVVLAWKCHKAHLHHSEWIMGWGRQLYRPDPTSAVRYSM